MSTFFSTDAIFWLTALLGTGLFIPKIFFGGLTDSADCVDCNGGTDLSFSIFSMHSLSGFFMMFGWAGLAASKQFDLSDLLALLIAFAGGLCMLGCMALIFRAASKMTSPGAVYELKDTIGQRATVYLQIPATGRGLIQLDIAGLTRDVEAVSESGSLIPSFCDVEVVAVQDPRTVRVRAL
ncbi:MAG: hypothetical protein KDK78_02750 [Chlamydiia bacterium]|nr:hypothetical protein [Chlamydiia bacterium]